MALLLPLIAWASGSVANTLEECVAKADGSPATAGCHAVEVVRLEKEVRVALRDALKRIDEDSVLSSHKKSLTRNLLMKSQRQWNQFRGTDCLAAYEAVDGTGASLAASQCHISHIQRRLEDLSKW